MQKLVGIFILSLFVTACSNAQEQGEKTENTQQTVVTLDTADKFKELMNNESAQLIDVRTPEEFAQGKIGNATNMNFFDANFKEQVATLDTSKPVLVYCASGGRSAKAVAILQSLGFTEIHELKGGYNAW